MSNTELKKEDIITLATVAYRAYMNFDREDYCEKGIGDREEHSCFGCRQYEVLRSAYEIARRILTDNHMMEKHLTNKERAIVKREILAILKEFGVSSRQLTHREIAELIIDNAVEQYDSQQAIEAMKHE